MKKIELTVPELVLTVATRALLGAGVALLVSDKLEPPARRSVGWTLVAIGALTTLPLAAQILGENQSG